MEFLGQKYGSGRVWVILMKEVEQLISLINQPNDLSDWCLAFRHWAVTALKKKIHIYIQIGIMWTFAQKNKAFNVIWSDAGHFSLTTSLGLVQNSSFIFHYFFLQKNVFLPQNLYHFISSQYIYLTSSHFSEHSLNISHWWRGQLR